MYLKGGCTSSYSSEVATGIGYSGGFSLNNCNDNTCTSCTNGPTNSYYTAYGSGPTSNCAWSCNSGYTLVSSMCVPPCNAGSYYNGIICTACSSGTFSPGGVVISCSPCINSPGAYGSFSGPGTTNTNCPWACNAGYYRNGATCVACSSGTYSTAGATACSSCVNNPGAYATYTGPGTNATNCPVACKAAAYLSGGTCTPCAVGTYNAGGSATTCQNCTNDGIANSVFVNNSATSQCPRACKNLFYQAFNLLFIDTDRYIHYYNIPQDGATLLGNGAWVQQVNYQSGSISGNLAISKDQSYLLGGINEGLVQGYDLNTNTYITLPMSYTASGGPEVTTVSQWGSVYWTDNVGDHLVFSDSSGKSLYKGYITKLRTEMKIYGYLSSTTIWSPIQDHTGTRVYFSKLNAAIYVLDNATNTYSTVTTTVAGAVSRLTISSGDTFLIAVVSNQQVVYVNLTTNTTSIVAGTTSSGYVDGTGANARFANIGYGIALSPDDTLLFVMDAKYLRKIVLSTSMVSTLHTLPANTPFPFVASWTPCLACAGCSPGQSMSGSCSSAGNNVVCTACATGYYTDTTTSTSCSLCTNNPGVYGILSGPGTNATNCPVTCNAGTYLSGGTCTPCAVGTYSAGGSATVCGACTNTLYSVAVYTSSATNSTGCSMACPTNYYTTTSTASQLMVEMYIASGNIATYKMTHGSDTKTLVNTGTVRLPGLAVTSDGTVLTLGKTQSDYPYQAWKYAPSSIPWSNPTNLGWASGAATITPQAGMTLFNTETYVLVAVDGFCMIWQYHIATGARTNFAGTNAMCVYADGHISTAMFRLIMGLAVYNNLVYIAESEARIRVYNTQTGMVSTLTGDGTLSYQAGTGSTCRLNVQTNPQISTTTQSLIVIHAGTPNRLAQVDFNGVCRFLPTPNISIMDGDIRIATNGDGSLVYIPTKNPGGYAVYNILTGASSDITINTGGCTSGCTYGVNWIKEVSAGPTCAACKTCSSNGYRSTPCPQGSTSDVSTCACNAGYYGDGLTCTACRTCGPNAYLTTLCQPGSTSDVTTCSCNPGYYTNGISTVASPKTCVACETGTYSNTIGATSYTCVQCPAGTFNNQTGRADATWCLPCRPGWFGATNGSSVG